MCQSPTKFQKVTFENIIWKLSFSGYIGLSEEMESLFYVIFLYLKSNWFFYQRGIKLQIIICDRKAFKVIKSIYLK